MKPLFFALIAGCSALGNKPVAMTGRLMNGPDADATPVANPTLTVRDGNAELFAEATGDADGTFSVDVPAGAFFTVTSSAEGHVPTSISGQAAAGPFDAGDGNVWAMPDQQYAGIFDAFSGCPNVDLAGGLIYGQVRLWTGSTDDGDVYTVNTATAIAYGQDDAEIDACYLDDDGGDSGLATSTGSTGYFAVFGMPEGASTMVLNYSIYGNSVDPYYWPLWIPEDGVAPLLPAYVEGT